MASTPTDRPPIKHIFGPMRLPFLILPPACVLLGVATAVHEVGRLDVLGMLLALVGAVSGHISVNAFNEYFDFKSGLDFKTQRTPFSGGSGTLPEHPGLARKALLTAMASFGLTGAIGIYFLVKSGFMLLPLGLFGMFLIYAYTPWLAYNPLLCLLAPGLGFGPVMVMGTHFVLSGHYSWAAFAASLIPFFLVSDLLLLNQFPDVEADRTIGRRHFPIVVGRKGSAWIYILFLTGAYLVTILAWAAGIFPAAGLLGLLTAPLAIVAGRNAYRHADAITELVPYMGMNVVINIATPVLTAIGIWVG